MTDLYFTHKSKGGYNPCLLINNDSVLPNCVGYAWGQFSKLAGLKDKCKLPTSNAEDWYEHRDGYQRGSTPRVGAVICWRKGRTHNGSDGYGHVGIVEKVYTDGSILIGQSGYTNRKNYYQTKLSKPYNLPGYVFQGFIYNPAVGSKKYQGAWWTSTLHYGIKSDDVRKYQQFLCWYGITVQKDGSFGPATKVATMKLQKELGVATDGSVGPVTTKACKKVVR